MAEYYPYRFKTEEEMIMYFGYNWREDAFPFVGWNSDMNKYLGKDFLLISEYQEVYDTDKFSLEEDYDRSWTITMRMLIKNKSRIPNYSPRKIIKEI